MKKIVSNLFYSHAVHVKIIPCRKNSITEIAECSNLRMNVENGWMRIIHALKVIAAFHEFDVFTLAIF